MTTKTTCVECEIEIDQYDDHRTVHSFVYKDGKEGREYDHENSKSFDFCRDECHRNWAKRPPRVDIPLDISTA